MLSTQFNKDHFYSKSLDFFHLADKLNPLPSFFSLFFIIPDPKYLLNFQKDPYEIGIPHDISDYHSFSEALLPNFIDLSMQNLLDDLHYFSYTKKTEKGLAYITIELNLKIPASFQSDDSLKTEEKIPASFQADDSLKTEELNLEIPASFQPDDSLNPEESKKNIENGFMLNRFSCDLINLAVSLITESSKKLTIFSKECEMMFIPNEKPEHKFKCESFFIRKTLCYSQFETHAISEIQKEIQMTLEEMLFYKRILLQFSIEIAAFQFRKDLSPVPTLLDEGFFYFLSEKIVKELDKDNPLNEYTEDWVDFAANKLKSLVKYIEN